MTVCFVVTDQYCHAFAVTLISFFEHLKGITPNEVEVFIISDGLSKGNEKKLLRISKKYTFTYTILTANKSDFKGLPLNNHWHPSFYYRFLIADIHHVNKILYLDCDLLIQQDITQLWNESLHGKLLAAVQNPEIMHNHLLGLESTQDYFNAGIMLIDLKRWRDEKISQRAMEFLHLNGDNLFWPDQDAVNYLANNDWQRIDPKWNVQSEFFTGGGGKLKYLEKEVHAAIQNPAIIHFTGQSKPWDYFNRHPKSMEFVKLGLKSTYWWFYLKLLLIRRVYRLYKGI
jgi:lipopolysaccharide biosynthesis glycosyltransferase